MRFGEVPVGEAAGAILVHSLRFGQTALRKGRILSAADLALIAAAGIDEITVVQLDPGDIREDPAAQRIASAAAGPQIGTADAFTGRANLFAETKGLLVFDRDRLDRLNLVNEALTLGTLPPFSVVEPRQMVATVKIIPFAVPEETVGVCAAIAAENGPLLRVAPFRALSVGLIQTRLPGFKEAVLDKTRDVTAARLDALGCRLALERRCEHRGAMLAQEIASAIADVDMLLIHGASAIADRQDVIPAAIVAAGGRIDHFGMPVDPGNLLLLGHIGGKPVLGLPGCARSPKVNGFDWVLERLVAGVPIGPQEIMRMGAGGLLAETPSRGLPRAEATPAPAAKPKEATTPSGPRIAALLLAAGKSSRMGSNKMLEEIDGKPMVVRTAQRLLSSRARPIIAVLGNMADAVDAALGKLPIERARNPDFAEGLSTSVKCGIAALPPDIDGVIICLGDMPLVAARDIERLIAAFNPLEGRAIIVPTRNGKRGNPVLWAKRFLPEMALLSGDVGARNLIAEHAELVAEIEMDSDSVLVDIDTPAALAALRESARPSAA
ncbi:MAG TPA: molybdopterin-binding/glycosyltransferase family 2 protein [Stellaceae bacterium]|jgi:molybdenum cofactor cytidylyltransferase|nr:molybdopterin-binding/glycosyltransferase family 2 protein [Stellaceae bacterium]